MAIDRLARIARFALVSPLLVLSFACSSAPHHAAPMAATDPSDAAVRAAVAKAGTNAPEIECFLARFVAGDAEKRLAARWLVANMPGHGFQLFALRDAKDNDIPFDIDDFRTLDAAQQRLDALEKEHGSVDFKPARFDADLEHATCAYLTENLEDAFRCWRTDPWMRDVEFGVFLEFVLPYRGSNEPLSPGWRTAARERIAPELAKLGPNATLAKVTTTAIDAGHAWVPFSDRYYMHPTDQSYADMCRTRLGRCEDITNMITFAARASGGMVASDFTPWWANRDNNHAWEVAVDATGQGTAGLSNRAAKVYRKSFSVQADSLGAIRTDADKVPGFLKSRTIRDVTAQYEPVSEVRLSCDRAGPAGTAGIRLAPPSSAAGTFAYLAVFNGGEWRPIEWARPADGRAVFHDMGRGILYLPVWSDGSKSFPAGAPLILDDGGRVHPIPDLPNPATPPFTLVAATTVPPTPDADTRRTKPQVKVEAGKEYELFIWRAPDGWTSLGKRTAAADAPVAFESVPQGALCWLRAADGRALERPFTMEDGVQRFW
jgi:hypothetical protein